MVTSADVPLLDVQTIESMFEVHLASGAGATLLTAMFEDPNGYGRIIRTDSGAFSSIVEHRDASEEELEIKEVNAGVYVFDYELIKDSLTKIAAQNAAGEKYLTDALEIGAGKQCHVFAKNGGDVDKCSIWVHDGNSS